MSIQVSHFLSVSCSLLSGAHGWKLEGFILCLWKSTCCPVTIVNTCELDHCIYSLNTPPSLNILVVFFLFLGSDFMLFILIYSFLILIHLSFLKFLHFYLYPGILLWFWPAAHLLSNSVFNFWVSFIFVCYSFDKSYHSVLWHSFCMWVINQVCWARFTMTHIYSLLTSGVYILLVMFICITVWSEYPHFWEISRFLFVGIFGSDLAASVVNMSSMLNSVRI